MSFLLKSDVEEIARSLGDDANLFSGKRILITGGRGFLGRYFTEVFQFLNKNIFWDHGKPLCELVVLDNFITAGEHGRDVPNAKDIAFVEHDIIKPFYPERPVDFILHAAGIASPYYYCQYPIETLEVATTGLANMLRLAQNHGGSRLAFFSSSEIYGDPDPAHVPTKEDYRGYVDSLGARACYDESKRLGETLVRIFHEKHEVQATIIRPFNCLTADQKVFYQLNGRMFLESFEECYARTGGDPSNVFVPSFDQSDLSIRMKPVSNIIRRQASEDVFTINTKLGRSVTVTGDHVLFRKVDGVIHEIVAKDVAIGDYVSICRSLNVESTEMDPFLISDRIPDEHLSFRSPAVRDLVGSRCDALRTAHEADGGDPRMFSSMCQKWTIKDRLPASIFEASNIPHLDSEEICYRSSNTFVKNLITDVDKLLWLFGYTLANGHVCKGDGDYFVIYSDKHVKYLDKVRDLMIQLFGLRPSLYEMDSTAPILVDRSKIVIELFDHFGFAASGDERRVPGWIISLPPHQISKFLHGFWCGDGNHDAKTSDDLILFYNSNKDVIAGINALLLRLGHVGSVYEFQTKARPDGPDYTMYRIELHGVSGVQVNDLHTVSPSGHDVDFVPVKSVSKSPYDGFVYDFTVPGTANFFAGDLGMMIHNCYGPGMQKTDYRVLPNFGAKILAGEPLHVYGDGRQTRTFCYVTDAIRGFLQVLLHGRPGEAYNIGNPDPEVSMVELVECIQSVLGRKVEYELTPYPDSYPADEPNRRCPDISKASEHLGYAPVVSLDEGLKRFLEWAETAYSE